MKRLARTAVVVGIAAIGVLLAAGNAGAYETGVIIGRDNCQEVARHYRSLGYSARCNHIHGDRYYVFYEKSNRPSTGSFGS
ncbi:hypothetical protein [Nocardia asiatica]|uniref:hypothetical protein n=1 Tax=Nocardia asiatica TaxID=209252 RepID=UPI002457A455|nr:hypothetical protein [Nocardia asiatica]